MQLMFLREQILSSGLSIKELSCKYFICLTSLRKIKSMKFFDLETFPNRNFQKINDREKSIFKQQIMEYYDSVHTQFTSKEVQKHLIDLNYEVASLNTIVKIMKQDWNLTYIRWLSR